MIAWPHGRNPKPLEIRAHKGAVGTGGPTSGKVRADGAYDHEKQSARGKLVLTLKNMFNKLPHSTLTSFFFLSDTHSAVFTFHFPQTLTEEQPTKQMGALPLRYGHTFPWQDSNLRPRARQVK